MFLPIADYMPDLPPNNTSGASANLVNLYPRTSQSYGPVNAPTIFSGNALQGTPLGAIAVPDSGGNNYIFAGDASRLYLLSPGSTNWAVLNYGFSVPAGEFWNFTYFSPYVVAVAEGQAPQVFTIDSTPTTVSGESWGTANGSTVTFTGTAAHLPMVPGTLTVTAGSVTGTDNGAGTISGTGVTGTINYTTGAFSVTYSVAPTTGHNPTAGYQYGGNFSAMPGSPPQARYVAVIKDFVFLANTYDGTNGAQPQRVQWSAIGDLTTWPASGSTTEAQDLAGSQVIPGDQGWIMGVVGQLGNADGALFFEHGIQRIIFSGSPAIFNFVPAEGVRGTPSPKSIVQFGALVYYLGEDGFYAFDGATSTPIGLDKVDQTFWANVNMGFLENVVGAVDPIHRVVLWAYPSAQSNGTPDTLLIYNWALNKWSTAMVSTPYLFRSITQGYSLEGLNVVSGSLDALPYSLDSRVWTGGSIAVGVFDANNYLNYLTGSTLSATADTVEAELFPPDAIQEEAGRHAFVRDSIPMIDGGSPSVQIGVRNNLQASPSWNTASAINSEGKCPVRADGRFVRARVSTVAGQSFTNLQGCQVYATPSGAR